jgi:hypothetical protein
MENQGGLATIGRGRLLHDATVNVEVSINVEVFINVEVSNFCKVALKAIRRKSELFLKFREVKEISSEILFRAR